MTWGFQTEDDPQKQQQAAAPTGAGTPNNTHAVAPSPRSAAPGQTTDQQQRGGSFVNLRDYLAANNTSAKAAADKVGGAAQAQFQKATDAFGAADKSFRGQVDAGKADAQKTGTYAGPRDITQSQEWQTAQNMQQAARQSAGSLGTVAGRSDALARQYGRGAGGSLDSWLVGTQMGGLGDADAGNMAQNANAYAKQAADGKYAQLQQALGMPKAAPVPVVTPVANAAATNQTTKQNVTVTDGGGKQAPTGSTYGLAPGQTYESPGTASGQKGRRVVDPEDLAAPVKGKTHSASSVTSVTPTGSQITPEDEAVISGRATKTKQLADLLRQGGF